MADKKDMVGNSEFDKTDLAEQYSYDQHDFELTCNSWGVGADNFQLSKFDQTLRSKWNKAMVNGCFRYTLDDLQTKLLPGRFKLILQLNERRFADRRKPQQMTSVAQPFDESKFNFTKVHDKEILFEMYPLHKPSNTGNLMIINISPLEFGNSLLVPSANLQLPQILTEDALQLALETSLLSTHRGFRIGFNSLCALASVNHLHFHVWYINYETLLETISLKPISLECQEVYEVCDYPARAFVCLLRESSQVPYLARKIHNITSYLTQKNIAHNVLIIRGADIHSSGCCVRVFIWPRKSVVGAKDECVLNIAVCELAGQLPLKTKEVYDSFTEKDFCNELSGASLRMEQIDKLKHFIANNFDNKTK